MPQAIIGYIASYLAVSVAVATVIYYVAVLAVTYAVGQYQSSKAKRKARDAYNASLEDRLVMTATTDGARSRVYGRVRNVDGIIFKGTHGPNKEFYTLVVAVAGHEVDAIEQVYLNDTACTLDVDGYVQEAPYSRTGTQSITQYTVSDSGGNASVTLSHTPAPGTSVVAFFNTSIEESGQTSVVATVVGSTASASVPGAGGTSVSFQYQGNVVSRYARVWKYLGTASQDIGADILASRFPSDILATDKFSGIACVVVEFTFTPDAFPGGIPGVSAIMRGAKIHDPRTGLTVWSENPAIIARDWARYAYGGACLSTEVRDASVIAAANACDVSTVFNTVDGPSAAMPLYTCGIVCKLDTAPDVWMDEIIESMAGKWGWPGGELTMVAGVYRSPVAAITEDWVSGVEDIVVVKDPPRGEVVNVYRPTIANKGKYPSASTDAEKSVVYVVAPTPEIRSDAFITADGQELVREIELGGVTDVIHAQHVCGVLMRDARDGLTLKLPCNLRAYPLELFDIVTVTLPRFGFNAKTFEIIDWEFSLQNAVILTMKETVASIYDPASGLDVLDAAPNTELQRPWFVETLTGLNLESGTDQLLLNSDGTVLSRILATWDPAQDASITQAGAIEVNWGPAESAPETWQTIEVKGSDTQVYLTGVEDGRYYIVRIRALNILRVRGDWSTQVSTVVIGKTEPPPPVDRFKLIEQPGGVRQFFWDYTSPPVDLFAFEAAYALGTDERPWDELIPLFAKDRNARNCETSDPMNDDVYTFGIRAIDTTGNASTVVYITEVLDGDAFGPVELIVLPHEERWPGTKTDCIVVGSTLDNSGLLTWDDVDVEWGLTSEIWGVPASPIVYEHPAVDLLSVAARTIRVNQLVSGSAVAEISTSNDGASYSAWGAVPSTPVTARYHKFRWTVSGSNPRMFRAQVIFYS